MNTKNYIGSRLAKLPHVIQLPAELPDPPELQQLLERRIADLNAEQSRLNLADEDQAFEAAANKCILAILHQHLTELRHDFPEINAAQPPTPNHAAKPSSAHKINFAKTTGFSGSDLPPQQHPTGSQVGPGGSDPLTTGSGPLPDSPPDGLSRETSAPSAACGDSQNRDDEGDTDDHHESDPSGADSSDDEGAEADESENTADDTAFEFLDDDLRDMAFELNEHLTHRSPFANLTNNERKAILKLLQNHSAERVAELVLEPPPVGLNLKTSKSALNRFRHDHPKYHTRDAADELHKRTRKTLDAEEKDFAKVNKTNETFLDATELNIKKRLFRATKTPDSDYHEIRWLLKSLEMLRKPNES